MHASLCFNCLIESRLTNRPLEVNLRNVLTFLVDSALAKCWAPKLYLKSNEKYFPSSVDFFLRHVSLYDNGRHKKQTHLTSMNLVQMGASNWYLSSNAHLGSATSRLPFFSGEDPRTHSVPTYCLVRHHGLYTDFVYWFFRPYNYGKKVCIGYVTCVGCVGKSF